MSKYTDKEANAIVKYHIITECLYRNMTADQAQMFEQGFMHLWEKLPTSEQECFLKEWKCDYDDFVEKTVGYIDIDETDV